MPLQRCVARGSQPGLSACRFLRDRGSPADLDQRFAETVGHCLAQRDQLGEVRRTFPHLLGAMLQRPGP